MLAGSHRPLLTGSPSSVGLEEKRAVHHQGARCGEGITDLPAAARSLELARAARDPEVAFVDSGVAI